MNKFKFLLLAVVFVLSLNACKGESYNNSDTAETTADGGNASDDSATDREEEDSITDSKQRDNLESSKQQEKDLSGQTPEDDLNNSNGSEPEESKETLDDNSQDINTKDNKADETNGSNTKPQNGGSTAKSNTELQKDINNSEELSLKLGDGSTLVYTKHEISKDYQDESMICIYFDYTNQSETAKSSSDSFDISCFQNGKECDKIVLLDGASEYKNMMKDIKKGSSITICLYFYLEGKEDVEVNITPYDSPNSKNKAVKTLKTAKTL